MARPADKLKASTVRNTSEPGRYGDGNGLWLQVQTAERKSWLFRYSFKGHAHEMGLGPYPRVSLAEAREKARDLRVSLKMGVDPLAAKRGPPTEAAALTFEKAAARLIEDRAVGWRNAKHKDQWHNTLATYVFPVIGGKLAREVTVQDVLAVLQPIWVNKHETASRLRGRIEEVLGSAAVREQRQVGYYNPAVWKGNLAHFLPKRRSVARVEPHVALPWAEAPSFMMRLAKADGVGARALEWTIATAARSAMTIGATWKEIDETQCIWRVGSSRMKSLENFKVPLSPLAMSVLEAVRPLRRPDLGDYVFPGVKRGKPISNMTMARVLMRLQVPVNVHGFRSTFRDWAAEETNHPSDVAEAALDHVLPGGSTRSAYQRGDLLGKRVQLMDDWGKYLSIRLTEA